MYATSFCLKVKIHPRLAKLLYFRVAHTHKVWAFRGMSKQQQKITKQLQNLYSWTQFYQETGNKEQIRKCQTEIAQLKKAYNELKNKKK